MRNWLLLACLAGASQAQPAQGKTWVVSVGIDDYQRDSVPDLQFADADAKLMAQAFQDLARVPAGNVFVLTSDTIVEDNTPKATNILYRLSWLKQHAGAADTVVFFFAGHGMHVDGRGFLLTEEADSRSTDTLKASSLPVDTLFGSLRAIPCARVMTIFDACRNDPTGKATPSLSEPLTQNLSLTTAALQSATVFSCNIGERSWEWKEKQHGFFSYHFAEGLKAGALQSDGRITLQSLTNYLSRVVPESTARLAGGRQTPMYRYEGPGLDSWVMASLAPPKTSSLTPAEQSRLVAELDATRARLGEALAQQKILEERLALDETERKRLTASLSVLEQRTQALAVPAGNQAEVAARDQAVRRAEAQPAHGAGTANELLEAEKEELKAQNSALSARIRVLELKLAQLGMASRSLDLSSNAEWQRSQGQPEAERLRLEQNLILQRVTEIQSWLVARQNGLPTQGTPETQAQLALYESAKGVLQQRLNTAQLALRNEQTRRREAELRAQNAEASLAQEQLRVQALQAENAQLREQLTATRKQAEQALSQLHTLEESTGKAYPGRAFDSEWQRITRRGRASDIYVEPNAGSEAQPGDLPPPR